MELEKVTVTTATGEKQEGFFLDTEDRSPVSAKSREVLDYAAVTASLVVSLISIIVIYRNHFRNKA